VKRQLDLERPTAVRYVERYAIEKLDLFAPRDWGVLRGVAHPMKLDK
jgi:hypothetical protein